MQGIHRQPRGLRGHMRTPPLLDYLKSILDQYPDDGQILKELIQNAEDAGATKVVFLMDHNTYGTDQDKLYSEDLKSFQGPALYSYNDAVLTQDDWDGISCLGYSQKAENPLKVGRFGLGFKSVFHITDLPGIYSGSTIGFLDPQERYFQNMSIFCWNLENEEEHSDVLRLSDQFETFKQELFGVGGMDFEEKKFCNGTIFRFPLRNQVSELSNECYNEVKIEHLLHSLKKENDMLLLFLKNIESVSFYEKKSGQLKKLIEFKVADECAEIVRRKRKELKERLLDNVDSWHGKPSFTISYPLNINVSFDDEIKSFSKWIICQHFAGIDCQPLPSEIIPNYLPLVGIAVKLNLDNQTDPYGQIFCFLPLPLDEKSPTGFRFHVHASFAVDQNRRHLKQITADQDENMITDKDLIWNKFLITKVLPQCFSQAIAFIIDNVPADSFEGNESQSKMEFASFVYSLLPQYSETDYHWQKFVSIFNENYLGNIRFYSTVSQTWLDRTKTLFCNSNEGIPLELLTNIMSTDNKQITILPAHLIELFSRQFPTETTVVSHETICSIYLRHQNSLNLKCEEKIFLLQYLIDKNTKIDSLLGTDLLPLEDSSWTVFQRRMYFNIIFIPPKSYDAKILFPKLKNKFLKYYPFYSDEFLNSATKLCQISYMSREGFAELVVQMLQGFNGEKQVKLNTEEWFTLEWLEEVWKHINQHYSSNLKMFENCHLLLVDEINVIRLKKNEAIMGYSSGDEKSKTVKKICEKLGVIFIERQDNVLHDNNCLLNSYILPPTFKNILKLLTTHEIDKTALNINSLSDTEKHEFLINLARESNSESLSCQEIDLLKCLPIFPTVQNSGKKAKMYVSLKDVNKTCFRTLSDIPVPCSELLLDISYNLKSLAELLEIECLSKEELIDKLYLSALRKGNQFYADNEIQDLMKYICRNRINFYQPIKEFMKDYKFVMTKSRSLVLASDVFDPTNDTLVKLMDEKHFPSFEWLEYIESLKNIGLKSELNITVENVVEIAKSVPSKNDPQKFFDMLMDLLSKCKNLLKTDDLKNNLLPIKWIPIAKDTPEYYKVFLNDQNVGCVTLNMVFSSNLVHLVGSVDYVVKSNSWKEVESYFGWSSDPPVSTVVSHLKNVIKIYDLLGDEIVDILKAIYHHLDRHHTADGLSGYLPDDLEWIWNGEKFCKKGNMVMEHCDFQPYVYTVPRDVKNFTLLWRQCKIPRTVNYITLLGNIKDYHEGNNCSDSERIENDLNLSIRALNELIKKEIDIESIRDQVYIPIRTDNNSKLQMDLLRNTTFCDKEIYDHIPADLLKNESTIYVHEKITKDLASKLKMKTDFLNFQSSKQILMPFGQSENLIDRINGLLSCYCLTEDILKEMLQNADDTGASEVHFIKDNRQHGTKKIFHESWEPLQGPALCVYNDKSFTIDDFEGIQKLGRGSKQNDIFKTGQFGVGFNAVYQVTDAPSFLTTIEGDGKNALHGTLLAIFDPNCSFLPNVTKTNPGCMYPKRFLTEVCSDVYSGYLQNFSAYDVTNTGTIFRLPLRNEKTNMKSEIKKEIITTQDLSDIFTNFQNEMCDCLIFMKSVRSLALIDINETLRQIYKVECVLSPENSQKKDKFMESTKEAATDLFNDPVKLNETECQEVIYELQLKDDKKKTTEWIVVQRFGFEDANKIPPGVQEAFNKRNILLQPKGGIAFKKPNTSQKQGKQDKKFSQKFSEPKSFSKLFNLLPLPYRTNLPCHINGQFIMSSEGRRDLIVETYKTFKSEWNELIISQLIVPAYCSLLIHYQKLLKMNEDEKFIATYYNMFPNIKHSTPQVKYLIEEFYRYIHMKNKRLFLECKLEEYKGQLSWISSGNEVEVYFDTLSKCDADMKCVKTILLNLGMKLISCPHEIVHNFKDKDINVPIKEISPKYICEHLLKERVQKNICQRIESTAFENDENLKVFLSYLSRDKKDPLYELPVLLTGDGTIQCATSECLFTSKYSCLFPHHKDKFVHKTIEGYFKPFTVDERKIKILKDLQINDFKNFLSDFKPFKQQSGTKCLEANIVTHFKSCGYGEIKDWLASAWEFLKCVCKERPKDKSIFSEISELCILPVKIKNENYLYPLNKLHCVVNEVMFNLSSNRAIYDILENIGVPVLREFENYDSLNDFLKSVVGDVTNPSNVLESLQDILLKNRGEICIDRKTSHEILNYFDQNKLNMDEKKWKKNLRELPIFYDITDQLCHLSGVKVVLVPNEIPKFNTAGYSRTRYIFLKNENFMDLYKLILNEKELISNEEFYIQYIIPIFNSSLSSNERYEHIKFIKDKYLCGDKKLALYLRSLQFLRSSSGEVMETRYFYSAKSEIFKIMETNFPRPPYDDDFEWYNFLIRCGLIDKLQSDKFIEYANKVSSLNDKDGCEVSELLLRELDELDFDKKTQLLFNNLIANMKHISFVVPGKIKEDYLKLHSAYSKTKYVSLENAKLYTEQHLYWTVCNIMPNGFSNNYRNIVKKLAMYDLNLNLFLKHMSNVYSNINEIFKIAKLNSDESLIKTVQDITNKQLKCLNREVLHLYEDRLKLLSALPLIYVDSMNPFVTPNQCAIDITEENEILPYIFKLPFRYGEFVDLLKKLGTTNKISKEQCIRSLQSLKDKQGDQKMMPDEMAVAKKLFDHFLNLLTEQSAKDVEKLFIPCDTKILESSEKVICSDITCDDINEFAFKHNKPVFKHGLFKKLFWLPEKIRPKSYHEVVNYTLSSQGKPVSKTVEIINLENRLQDVTFQHGFSRIISKAIEDPEEADKRIRGMNENLAKINFECVEFIELIPIWNGEPLEDMAKTVDFHVTTSNYDNPTIEILVTRNHQNVTMMLCDHIINECFVDLTNEKLMLEKILTCNIQNINETLDFYKYTKIVKSVMSLGAEIDFEEYFELSDEKDFYKEQILAHEIDDPLERNEDGDAKYVYVSFIKKVNNDLYEIDSGQTTFKVSPLKLYKFKRIGASSDPSISNNFIHSFALHQPV